MLQTTEQKKAESRVNAAGETQVWHLCAARSTYLHTSSLGDKNMNHFERAQMDVQSETKKQTQ